MIKGKARLAAALVMLLLACTSARAQQPPQPPPPADEPGWLGDSLPPLWERIYVNVNAARQLQLLSFGTSSTFDSFGEVGGMATSQNVGHAMLFDVAGGYRFTRHLGIGIDAWTAIAKSAVAGSAAMPDAIVYGQFLTSNLGADDLRQLIFGVNLQVVLSQSFGDHLAVSGFIGPTFAVVRQDVGSMAVEAPTRTATLVIDHESARTTKAGNAGIDIAWMMNERYGFGVVARYVAGTVNLPSVSNVKVGGLQVGAGLRYRF